MTASRNRGGAYLRSRVIPVNPNTERQGMARANMASAVNAWTNILTDANRQAWITYAQGTPVVDRLGAQLILSGQQMFVRCTLPRLVAGQPLITAGPITAGLANTPVVNDGMTVTTATGIVATVNVDGSGATGALNVYMSEPTSPSRTVAHSKRAWAAVETPPVADAFDVAVAAASLPYDIVVGAQTRITFLFLDVDGRVSTEVFRDVVMA